jgi:trimeric autotransporter adhesin
MKKIKLVIVFALVSFFSWGQTVVEDFNYKSDSTLTSNGWSIIFSKSIENALKVNNTGLTYPNYPSAGFGVNMTTTGQDVGKFFTPISTGSVYMSFLVNVSAAQAGDNFAGIMNGPAPSPGVAARAFIKSSGKGFVFGLGKSAVKDIPYETTLRNFGTTYLVVLKYTFNSQNTTDDIVYMWVNPALGTTETTPQLTMGAGIADAKIGLTGPCIIQRTAALAPTLQIDGIRTSTTWASATPSSNNKK